MREAWWHSPRRGGSPGATGGYRGAPRDRREPLCLPSAYAPAPCEVDRFVPIPHPRPASRARAWLGVLLAALAFVAVPADAFARASGGRSSGGYSRPSVRTPSFGGGGGGYRTPSTNGGYSRPSQSYSRPSYTPPPSAGDRSFSQGRSGAALDSYRAQQETARRQPIQPRGPQPRNELGQYQSYGYRGGAPARSSWFGDRGYAAPPTSYFGGNRSFGVWDGLFIGALLSNLGRSGSADWFHNNQNDPGYRQWRAEAERQAQDNAELRGKLDDLDRQLKERESQPRTPGALPPDVPDELAKAPVERTPGTSDGGGSSFVWIVLLAGAGGIAYLAWRRRPRAAGGSTVSPPNTTLGAAGAMLRQKLSGEAYTPSKFRVGMTIALDPTPFILAGDGIKLHQPTGGASGQVSVTAVGRVTSGNTQLTRLYLPDGFFVQLHLDAAGDPDECRLFGTIDEIAPADPGEWAAWLDPNEGMIGWPEFQTKDGKTYARAWIPGEGRVSPRQLSETIEDLNGSRTITTQAMLYAGPTGAPNPAPATEYILVAALQDAGRASVEIRAGIDINPVTLQLA